MIITESGSIRKGHHANGHLQLTEAANVVSVADLRDRTLLWAGYPSEERDRGGNYPALFSRYGSVDIHWPLRYLHFEHLYFAVGR
jgi:hypothetical protein